jgi:hypothetical protein
LDSYAGVCFDKERLDIQTLIHWKVPARFKKRVVSDLETLGINRRMAYPDLDGLATGIWETEVLRKG